MLGVIASALLLAFGILAIFFSLNEVENDRKLLKILVLGIVCIAAGGWYLVSAITLIVLLTKLAALIIAVIGLFLIVGFPDVGDYQIEGFSKTGVFIGLVMLIIGAYFLFF